MTKAEVKEILNRVLTWPQERQENAAKVLAAMEEQDHSDLHLTDEQAAEVRRRMRMKNPKYVPAKKVFDRILSRHS